MEKQITKVQALQEVQEILAKEEVKSFVSLELSDKIETMLNQEIKVVENKKGKKGISKTAKEKVENVEKAEAWFFEKADPEVFYSGAEIAQTVEGFEDFTPQKMTPIVKTLVENGVLEKGIATSDKKKAGYKIK